MNRKKKFKRIVEKPSTVAGVEHNIIILLLDITEINSF